MSNSSNAPLLLHVFPTFGTGGAQVRFCDVANFFGHRWRHIVVAMDDVTTCRERLDPKLDITFTPMKLPKGNTIGNVLRCRSVLTKSKPATLLTTNWGSIEWALANIPVGTRHVHIEEGLGPDEVEHQYLRRVWTRRLALRRS